MNNLTVVDHPLLKRDLTILRRRETPYGLFRKTLSDAAAILAYEAMRALDLRLLEIETPLETTTGYEVADEVFVVPILRAGLGMVDGFVRFVPAREQQQRQHVRDRRHLDGYLLELLRRPMR